MNALRWVLGSLAVVLGGGFFILVLLGNAFRKSFGASEHGPLFIILPALGFALLFAAILFPGSKPLLHVAAIAALGLVGFCLWQIFSAGDAPLWLGVAYLATWFVYYWLAAWRVTPQP
ncbi:MAG TPA: hypothetical protein PKE47_00010 [Verrucomicrobiota bacterium]|nr:hypothetical protein [Verrucomicrobiota bacterium]